MTGHQVRGLLNRLTEQLEVGQAWLHHEPPCALWLDGQRRVNVCAVQEYAVGTPLVRVSVNRLPLMAIRGREGWPDRSEMSLVHPDWKLDIVCLDGEAAGFVAWLASVVTRREGYLSQVPPPPHHLLHWDDLGRLDDYLYYLSSVSVWSEAAFHEDIRWSRHAAPAPAHHDALVA